MQVSWDDGKFVQVLVYGDSSSLSVSSSKMNSGMRSDLSM